MKHIPEKDWKQLRSMQAEKRAIFCGRILDKTTEIAQKRDEGEHQAFLNLWEAINERNAKIAELFDDIRRSNAIHKLIAWKLNGLLKEEELELFTEATRAVIKQFEQWQR